MTEFYKPQPQPVYREQLDGTVPEQIPISFWCDTQIREAMLYSVSLSELDILELTKALNHNGYTKLKSISISLPFDLPTAEKGLDANNKALRIFAFDAYDALQKHFQGKEWGPWVIAPFFRASDDTRTSFELGVFVGQEFTETVVE